MKKLFFPFCVLLIFSIFFLISCKTQRDPISSYSEFGNQYIELGKDSDHSFMSVLVKNNNDDVELEIVGWGIKEYGLWLNKESKGSTLFLNIMEICGTVSSRTWDKVKFNYTVPDSLEKTITKLKYFKGTDTLYISKR